MNDNLQLFKIRCKGVKPLLMHNVQMANPLHPLTRELKKYSSKRTKTDEDHLEMSRLEFIGGCYWDEENGFHIPSEVLETAIVQGAKISRNGKKVPLAVNIKEFKIPLKFNSIAKTPEELYNDVNFQDVRLVKVQTSKVLRTRPRFDQWEINFTVELDTTLMNNDEFFQALNYAGQRIGIGDFRPKYGIFEVDIKQIG